MTEPTFLGGDSWTFDSIDIQCEGILLVGANVLSVAGTVTVCGTLLINGTFFEAEILEMVTVGESEGRIEILDGLIQITGGARRALSLLEGTSESRGSGFSPVWVDFGSFGTEGTEASPCPTIACALSKVLIGGEILIKADTPEVSSAEMLTVTQAVTIRPVNGSIFIGGPGASDTSRFGLQVEVEDGTLQTPISDAGVALRLDNTSPLIFMQNFGSGIYTAMVSDIGAYDVTVVAPDFPTANKTAVIAGVFDSPTVVFSLQPLNPGSTIFADIPLGVGNDTFLFPPTIELFPENMVDPEEEPLARTSVIEGNAFKFEGLSAGTFDLFASTKATVDRFTLNIVRVTVGTDDTQSVSFSASTTALPALIQGTVEDTENPSNGIAGARVEGSLTVVVNEQFESLLITTTSDADGVYTLADVAAPSFPDNVITIRAEVNLPTGIISSDSGNPVTRAIFPNDVLTGVDIQIDLNPPDDPVLLLRNEFDLADNQGSPGLLDATEAFDYAGLGLSEFNALNTDPENGAFLDLGELLLATVGPVGIATPVWSQFDYDGGESEIGNEARPFDSLAEAVKFVKEGGVLEMIPSDSTEIGRIEKALTLKRADGFPGVVRIGIN